MSESDGAVAGEGGAETGKTPRLVEIESMMTGEFRSPKVEDEEETLWTLLRRFAAAISSADRGGQGPPPPPAQRIRSAFSETAPRLREAFWNSGRELLLWARRGSPLTVLLIVSVGTITLLALTGLLVFMLFFLAATFNAIVVSLLFSLAAAGGFLALFFACLAAIYIGALFVGVFIVTTTTVSMIIAVFIATGWIGLLLTIWLLAKKSVGLAKHSLSMTGSAFSAYSEAHRFHHQPKKDE